MTGLARRVDGLVTTMRIPTPTDEVETLRATRARIRSIARQVMNFMPEAGVFVIEAPAINSVGGKKIERVWLYGMLVDRLLTRGPVVAVQPTTRAAYAANNGRAKKPEVLAAIRAAHPLLRVPDDNIADAVALLAMGARFLDQPIDGQPSVKQLKAMRAPAWPDLEEESTRA